MARTKTTVRKPSETLCASTVSTEMLARISPEKAERYKRYVEAERAEALRQVAVLKALREEEPRPDALC